MIFLHRYRLDCYHYHCQNILTSLQAGQGRLWIHLASVSVRCPLIMRKKLLQPHSSLEWYMFKSNNEVITGIVSWSIGKLSPSERFRHCWLFPAHRARIRTPKAISRRDWCSPLYESLLYCSGSPLINALQRFARANQLPLQSNMLFSISGRLRDRQSDCSWSWSRTSILVQKTLPAGTVPHAARVNHWTQSQRVCTEIGREAQHLFMPRIYAQSKPKTNSNLRSVLCEDHKSTCEAARQSFWSSNYCVLFQHVLRPVGCLFWSHKSHLDYINWWVLW